MTESTTETATELRLVRCPKCENLLPELADYSLYQCGGCGAVLQARHQTIESPDASSDKLNEERGCQTSTNSHHSLQKGVVDVSDVSVFDLKSVANSLSCCNASFPENPNLLGYAEKTGNTSGVENGLHGKKKGDEPDSVVERKPENLSSPMEYSGESWRSGRMAKWRTREKSAIENLQTSIRHDVQGTRFSGSNYSHDGPSSSYSDTLYNNREPMMNHNHIAGVSRVQYGEDRAELLKKLDDLKDQVIRSCEVTSKPKDNIPVINPSMQYFQPDRHASALPPYYSHCPEPFRYEGPSNNFYPPPPPPQPLKPDHNIGYGDPFERHMLRRPSHQVSSMYQQPPPHPYFSGQYVDPSSDILHNTPFHQSSCSCFLCYTKNERGSAPVPSMGFGNRRFSSVPYNAMQYCHENPPIFEPNFQNSRTNNPPLRNLHAHPVHNRWPSDINSEMNDIDLHRARKLVLPSDGNFCNPVAGAAPFLTCFNCFELLQLPKKLLLTLAKQKKLRCGACSTIIKFSIIDKKVIFSSNSEKMCNPSIIDDDDDVLKNRGNIYGHVSQFSANFSSDDNEFSQGIDREPILMSKVQDSDSSNPQEMQTFHSSSLVTSEEDNITKVIIRPKEVINSIQQPIQTFFSSPKDPDSPLQENFTGSVANNHAVNRFGKGNRSSRSDQEKGDISKTIMRQNSMKETSLATETEMSFNDYSNTGVSQDSRDTDGEHEKYSNTKSSESFFANFIKRGFSKSNSADERGKSNVSVNGHFILERIVKKAEKLAGPIRPGQYWYDFRAGFWGVIGGPCLNIIPPHIEAFNYPMPENCAGGSTSIFVNGRELNVKDLDLLSSRGLPTDKDRSYIIEINGKVMDEDTGEELDCLGRLAPTVERLKHGFGMKVPKSAR